MFVNNRRKLNVRESVRIMWRKYFRKFHVHVQMRHAVAKFNKENTIMTHYKINTVYYSFNRMQMFEIQKFEMTDAKL